MEREPLAGGAQRSNGAPPPRAREASALDVDYPVAEEWSRRLWKASELWVKLGLGVCLGVTLTLAVVLSVLSASPTSKGGGGGGGGGGTGAGFQINFLAIGDWGRQGHYNQSQVAALMAARADSLRPEFIISTGDNMYPRGLDGADDPLFDSNFVNVYKADSLQVPWHAVLGNHDHGDGEPSCLTESPPCNVSPMHQLGAALINRDPRWHCERQYLMSLEGGLVDLFFLDTSPFVLKYRKEDWAKYPGGILEQSWEAQLREFEAQLAMSSAPWKLVVGHHPPHSNGKHGDTKELIQWVEPLLKQYGVQAWFAGHDHSLEHLYVDSASYHIIVSGAGSKCDRSFTGARHSRYQWPSSGFVAATLTPSELRVEFHNLEQGGADRPAYTAVIPRVRS